MFKCSNVQTSDYLWTAGLRASSEDYVVTTRKQPREWKQLLLRPPGVRSSRS